MTIAMTGLSFGGLALTPLSASLLQEHGLSGAVDYLALLLLLGVVPITLMYLKSFPKEDDPSLGANTHPMGIDYISALRHHFFWGSDHGLWASDDCASGQHCASIWRTDRTFVCCGGFVRCRNHAVVQHCRAFTWGLALEFVSTIRLTIFMMMIQGLALVVIGSAYSILGLYGGLALFGLCIGNVLMLQALIISEVYGPKHYARLFSLSNMMMVCGFSLGPFLMGYLQSKNRKL